MTLPKAVEIVQLNIREVGSKMPPDCLNALKLCCESAQRIRVGRNNPGSLWTELLPGETDENAV